tara:strand:+ start:548 stop:904 length:357 start_codon:yes stop_codon:yes gene_type:complete
MKKVFLLTLCILSLNLYGQSFVSPIKFIQNETNQNKVIRFIEQNVYKTYTNIGMGDPMTLRMMEKEELKCFKELTTIKNTSLLKRVINQYCNIGMCNYNTILMMYREQDKSNQESLSW